MDLSSDKWLSELEMDDDEYHIFNHYQMNNSLDDHFTTQDMATAMGSGNLIKQSFSSESYSTFSSDQTCHTSFERPAKQLKTHSWNSGTNYTDDQVIPRSSSSSSSHVLSFGNVGSPPTNDSKQFCGNFNCPEEGTVYNGKMNLFQGLISKDCSYENQNYAPKVASQGIKRVHVASNNRTPSHAQDHIMAERKRREKLSQKFIALSAIVPGLKKMDKASVLGDAIKYMKQLQERVNMLEEQTKKRTVESVVYVKKSQLTASGDEDTSSSDENSDVLPNEALPEIEARVSDKNVLIRIHCEKNKGVIAKVVSEIEKLHLAVVNSSVLPFGNHAMDITVVAQMENEFCMTVKDLMKNLRLAFLNLMKDS